MDALPQPGGITADFGLLTIPFLWGTQEWEPSQGFRRQTHTGEQIQHSKLRPYLHDWFHQKNNWVSSKVYLPPVLGSANTQRRRI